MRAKTYKSKRRYTPKILRTEIQVLFKVKNRLHMALNHAAESRHTTKSRIIRDALEYYLKWVIPHLKGYKKLAEKKIIIDYSKETIIDYAWAFDDSQEIPDEALIYEDYEDDD